VTVRGPAVGVAIASAIGTAVPPPAVGAFTVLQADGTSIACSLTVLQADGTSITVPQTVLQADGTSISVN
jgi:hypothetical protein